MLCQLGQLDTKLNGRKFSHQKKIRGWCRYARGKPLSNPDFESHVFLEVFMTLTLSNFPRVHAPDK